MSSLNVPAVEPGYQFASDNTAGICPEAWQALADANAGYAPSYGEDAWTEGACRQIRALFEREDAQVYLVFNGTAANALSLAAATQSYHGVLCHEDSHIHTDECAAPEFFSGGARLLPLPGANGKLSPESVHQAVARRDDLHFVKARALSLSQATEWGTVYSSAEVAALAGAAHAHGLTVHMDGARLANVLAAAPPEVSPASMTWQAGVDVLSLGGTKNGLASTEAVVFFKNELAREFDYRCKQAAQLSSKMRFQACQWQRVLESGAWLRHAAHANAMARRLSLAIQGIDGVNLARPVEANGVFVQLSARTAAAMEGRGWHFHLMDEAGYRLMCSWCTSAADVDTFARDLRRSALSLTS